MSHLDAKHFTDEHAARELLEAIRWPNGPVCPHCGGTDKAYKVKSAKARPGVYKCGHCRRQFTVTVGTLFERSKIPLHKWFQAAYLLCSSKKGISSHQLHRILCVTYQTAWFMSHRLREAMRTGNSVPLGGAGTAVEADETYYGEKADPAARRKPGQRGPAGKRPVVGLVERGGKVRTFHVEKADQDTIKDIVRGNVARESRLMTDESRLYVEVGAEMAAHETVIHSAEEYVRGDAHTNTMDGYWGLFKRGMRGVYQHCAEKHLHRYLAEFDFRYNNRVRLGIGDSERTALALKGIEGRRLMYRDSSAA